ncbi:hypothetical protein FB106_103222 [Synechococcus sp. Ace-Pa]|nr:hypothetical protein BM449_08325 [Synechococcus sp. SynAce01]TWB93940.1 hypothetical protein FB106_103222 [Synechococcus sp. Ace-Pa]
MGLERWRQKFGLPAIVDKLQSNDQDLLLGLIPPCRTTWLSGTFPATPPLPRQWVRRDQAQPKGQTEPEAMPPR